MPGGPPDRPLPIIEDYASVRELIAPVKDVKFWAIGHSSDTGEFSSLTAWNHHEGMLSFCGSRADSCRIGGYVGGDEIQVTVTDVLDYAFRCPPALVLFDRKQWFALQLREVFDSEMYRLRDWSEPRYSRELSEQILRNALAPAVSRLEAFLEKAA
ncbi:MAG: hypothetical protein AAFP81_00935 [Pseudomonadota bacterium]